MIQTHGTGVPVELPTSQLWTQQLGASALVVDRAAYPKQRSACDTILELFTMAAVSSGRNREGQTQCTRNDSRPLEHEGLRQLVAS
jgi:hypothetical protein